MEAILVDQWVQARDSVCIQTVKVAVAFYAENQIVLFKKEVRPIFVSLVIIRINLMFLNVAIVINHCKIIIKLLQN